nr:probable DNA-3-methyladenine glycosylase 2 isoform X1 [Ipomoea batatas]
MLAGAIPSASVEMIKIKIKILAIDLDLIFVFPSLSMGEQTWTQTQTLPDSESQPLTDPNADSGLGSDLAFLADAPIDIPRNHSNPSKIPIRPPENPKTFNPGDKPNNQTPTHLGSA